jgi:hypothetical protein
MQASRQAGRLAGSARARSVAPLSGREPSFFLTTGFAPSSAPMKSYSQHGVLKSMSSLVCVLLSCEHHHRQA